jgi:hypothetical protein
VWRANTAKTVPESKVPLLLLLPSAVQQPPELLLETLLPPIPLDDPTHYESQTKTSHQRITAALLDVVPNPATINLCKEHFCDAPLSRSLEQHPDT